jgi:hypothetical protein
MPWDPNSAFLFATNGSRAAFVSTPGGGPTAPTITAPLAGTSFSMVNGTASPTITTATSSGGTGSKTWSLVATPGSIPSGVTIGSATGILAGTNAVAAGTYNFSIRVTDSATVPLTDTIAITLVVATAGGGGGAALVYWGHFGGVLSVPALTSGVITALDNKMTAGAASAGGVSKSSRNGTYEFAAFGVAGVPTNPLCIIAWPSSFSSGAQHLKVSGFPWGLQPGDDTKYTTVTISGVPYDVFVTMLAANGGFTTAGGNPVIVT